ncbi:MAG: S-methyl-5'-thioadenosine phosphorylase [Nitrospira sp. NTP1]|nr:S-methyl-5'-thioadenosine phosphorylase [Nitrospira sp. NTP1]
MKKSKKTVQPAVGIIGGSGLYQVEGLEQVREVRIRTPFGAPSDAVVVGVLGGMGVAFLSRHGRGHRINPSSINYRANIYALKSLGVTQVISISAVGCSSLADVLEEAGRFAGATLQRGGTYVCMEGPQFSTKAESRLYRQWGVDVIGMTNMPEAKLAREAELCYATMALATDYDCWHETEEAVTVGAILATLHRNVALAKEILKTAVPKLDSDRACACRQALATALITAPDAMSASAKRRLNFLIAPYVRTRKGKR